MADRKKLYSDVVRLTESGVLIFESTDMKITVKFRNPALMKRLLTRGRFQFALSKGDRERLMKEVA